MEDEEDRKHNGENEEVKPLNKQFSQVQENGESTLVDGSSAKEGQDATASFKSLLKGIAITLFFTFGYISSNVKLVLDYSEAAENNRYVRMTLAYMIAPIFITSLISLAWYIDDDLQAKDRNEKPTPRKTWILRGIILFFQMGTVLRYIQALVFSHKSMRCKDGEKKIVYKEKAEITKRDANLLESFTSFMQGVPQYILQLYILTEGPEVLLKDGPLWQLLSMASSIGTITWAAVSCDKVLGSATQLDTLSDWRAIALLFPWRLFSIVSRMTILGLFSTLFPVYFGLGCVTHYLLMYMLIQRQKVATHNGLRGEVFLFLVGGLIFIITDLLVKYERSCHKYLVYYTIVFVEGVVMMIIWYIYCEIEAFYKHIIIIGVFATFLLGILFLRLFYEYNHPHHRKLCFCSCCQKQERPKSINGVEEQT